MLASWPSIHSQRPLNWLLENGCDVVFVDRKNPYPEGRDRYQFLPYPGPRGTRYYGRLGPRVASRFGLWTVALQLRLLWRRIRPDVVHLHWVNRHAYHCVKAGLRPLVLSVWGSDINRHFLPAADPEYRRIIGQALAHADLVIVDAQGMAEKCALLAGCEIRTELLHLGVNTKTFRPGYGQAANEWRRRLAVPGDAKVLLSIRIWRPQYGHHVILEAFSQALPRLQTDCVLVFKIYPISSHDSTAYEIELRRRAEQLGIARWVRWMEEVTFAQLPEIYAFADVIVNYPSMDTFPVTFLEAAACERPVISIRLPSYQGTFAERYFRMVEPGEVTDLANAIVELINQPSGQTARLLSEARRVVEQEYNESIYIQRLLDIYREFVCAESGAQGAG